MRKSSTVAAVFISAAVVGGIAPAAAAPAGGMDASDVVSQLRAEGYNVRLNGPTGIPLSQCTVSDVHGIPAGAGTAAGSELYTTVYVDINCQPEG